MTTRSQARSRRQEQAAAKRIGGRRTPGSGSGWAVKNDVRADDISMELKYTDKGSYSLKFSELKVAEKNALMDSGREFAFLVGFGTKKGAQLSIEREYVVVSREYFESLREAASGHSE